MNISNLPAKFQSSLASAKLTRELNNSFNSKRAIKNYVFETQNWFLKGPRTEGATTPDSHIYRVRKALKVAKFIKENGYGNDIAVAEKYLYWRGDEKRFYVASKRLDLSNEVARPSAQYAAAIRNSSMEDCEKYGGQILACKKGGPSRVMTVRQAQGQAELCFLGYTDTSYNNQYFTKSGKCAIIDTEPQKRVLKKSLFGNRVLRLLNNKEAVLVQQALTGTAKLKLSCSNAEAVKEIEKIEKKHVLAITAKLIAQIAFCIFLSYAIPALPLLNTTMKFCLTTCVQMKTNILAFNLAMTHLAWLYSHQGVSGTVKINKLETWGLL